MSNLNAWSKINGTWRSQGFTSVKIGGQWRTIARSFIKVDGVWRTAGLGSPPEKPVIVYHSTGQFRISNYNSSLNYQTIYSSGPGTNPSFNTSTGIYSLPDRNSAFFVSAAYAVGAPRSVEGYMERKAYRYSCRDIFGTCCDTCCVQQCNCGCAAPDANGCPPGTSPNGQCGCGGATPCMFGCIGCLQFAECNCRTCKIGEVCDVLINEPGYTNSGTEWYKVG
jgi:hypothetical protein